MTMKKLLRRRSAIRELLQSLETRPFLGDASLASHTWPSRACSVTEGSYDIPRQLCKNDRR
jgi:hypothetical protein